MQGRRGGCIVFDDNYVGYGASEFCLDPLYEKHIESILVPKGMIKDRLERMSVDILDYFEANEASSINLLCVLKGGFKFGSDLCNKLQKASFTRKKSIQFFMDFVVASTYVNDSVGHETLLNQCCDMSKFKNKDVLVVEDLVDSGTTLSNLVSRIKSFKPRSLMVACLLVKRRPDCNGFQPDFVGFEVPNRFVVGYAIDYNDFFRDVPHVCSINDEAKKKFALPNVENETVKCHF